MDAVSVAFAVGLSAISYLPRLGFYSDDWALLADFSVRKPSLGAVLSAFADRPVQGLYLDLLFRCFGFNALPYHIVNTVVLAAAAVLFYLLLWRLRLGRSASFAAALLFIMLPALSTVRVWFAAFQIPLSMALMFLSLHFQLSYSRTRRSRALAGAIAAALVSVGAYEIFAPLIAGFAAALAFADRRNRRRGTDVRAEIVVAGVLLAAVALIVIYKVVSSGRAGSITDPNRYLSGLRQLIRTDYDWRTDSGLNLFAMVRCYFLAPVSGVADGLWTLISGHARSREFVIAILIGILAGWRLLAQRRTEPPPAPLGQLGIATFLLGNATFLLVPSIAFTPTGMDNRVQLAAALGVAMILVAALRLACDLAPHAYRQAGFSVAIALVVASAFLRLTTIEDYWAQAPALQHQVLEIARADLRNLPNSSTVIIDGVCPYHGPAVVFEANWDTTGALSIALRRPISADVVSQRMTATGNGLETSIYKQPSTYAYGPNLYIYDAAHRRLTRLPDAFAAGNYFRQRSQRACPGYVARGVAV